MYEEWLKNLVSNPIFVLISFVLGVLGVVFSFIFYFKSKKEKKPYYREKSFTLIENLSSQVEGIKIFHNEKEIENLTITKMILWNGGKETIKNDDVTTIEPLKIKSTDDSEILDAKIIAQSNEANNFSLHSAEDKKSYELKFEYIDYENVVVFQIIHTSKSEQPLEFEGIIKGAGHLSKIEKKASFLSKYFITHLIFYMVGLIGIIFYGVPLISDYFSDHFGFGFIPLIGGLLTILITISIYSFLVSWAYNILEKSLAKYKPNSERYFDDLF